MEIEFLSCDPRSKARTRLDEVLSNGLDQLVIACAFCTAAGIELLSRHATRLSNKDSFLVVSVAPPTNYAELERLHLLMPSNLFVHWGALAPWELKNGAALMHSKVFYSRSGRNCWLWTGSHNLTANATQGGNCEAAILLRGTIDEKPFSDALEHLNACRNEATLYDPDLPPPGKLPRVDILVIHAEEAPWLPLRPLPWRFHLCLDSEEFDGLLAPPAEVRLFLYPKGSLCGGWQTVAPIAAYSGALTGVNFTAQNSSARGAGTTAAWREADFAVTEQGGVLAVVQNQLPGPSVTSQAVVSLDASSNLRETLFSVAPNLESQSLHGEVRWSEMDPDMRKFFRKSDVRGSELLHQPILRRSQVIRVQGDETRRNDFDKILLSLSPCRDIPIMVTEESEETRKKRHPFIVRAKYRLPDAE